MRAKVILLAQPCIDGWLIVFVAAIALIVDAITAVLTYTRSKQSVNIRAAFLHKVADALGSIAVIVAGTLILLYEWRLADPLVTVVIAGYILCLSFQEIGPVDRILMLGSPPGVPARDILTRMKAVVDVEDIHHVHFWQLDEHSNAVDAHVVIKSGAWSEADTIKVKKSRYRRGSGRTRRLRLRRRRAG